MQKLICFDVETGGLDAKQHSLLTLGMMVVTLTDTGIEFSDPHQWFVKHDVYKVTPGALKVNKINIEEHDSKAQPWQTVQRKIFDYWFSLGFDTENKISFIGHNVNFDLEFFKENIQNLPYIEPEYDEQGSLKAMRSVLDLIGHRHVDTAGIARFLTQAGVFPSDASAKSDYLFERYKKEIDKELILRQHAARHTAIGDVIRTAVAYREMIKEVRSKFDLGYLQAVEDLS
jgi:DNA polymerase III epsilon subunit-like protein